MTAFSLSLLLLAILASVYAEEERMEYEGLRLDMSALTLNRDILASFTPALLNVTNHTFADIHESSTFTKLRIHKLKVDHFIINEERFDMNNFYYTYPIYTIKGTFEAIFFRVHFEFEETFIGIPIHWGKGTADVTNVRSEILVFWNESDPDIQLPHPWDIKNLEMEGVYAPKEWVQTALHKSFIPHFHDAVDKSLDPFAHNLLKTYRIIEDVLPGDYDLIFGNNIMAMRPSVGGTYFSIAFKSNITVNKGIHKKFYRRMNGKIDPQGDFDYCLASQYVPDVFDALGKGRYFNGLVFHQMWGFDTDKVKEWCDILPAVCNQYNKEDTFEIHCDVSETTTVNDLGFRYEGPLYNRLQLPQNCRIHVPGNPSFLVVDVFLKFYYEMKCTNQAFIGHVTFSFLGGFRTATPLPEGKMHMLEAHLNAYAGQFTEQELLSPGIKVTPNRPHEVNFTLCYQNEDEICFYYDEIRPIAKPISKPIIIH
jgi:hypothetical protein